MEAKMDGMLSPYRVLDLSDEKGFLFRIAGAAGLFIKDDIRHGGLTSLQTIWREPIDRRIL